MNDDVLLKFLNKGLINVGGDDDKFGHLTQTATDLATVLHETPAKATPFALVAFDPDVPTSDPTIVEVEDALRQRWATYVNTFAARPITVFRAMLLHALIQACRRNDTVAAAFVSCARNVLPRLETGAEGEIWTDIVAEIEDQVDKRSEREWATPASIPVPDPKFKPPTREKIRIVPAVTDSTDQVKGFMAAAGPHYNTPNGQQFATDGNPHWPQNNPHAWAYEFGRRMTQAVRKEIAQAISSLSVEGANLSKITQAMMDVTSEQLKATLAAVSRAEAGLQRRVGLLWWKEAAFSPSARRSYRDLSPNEAAALMAFDLHREVPTYSPTSVSAFLREAVIALPTIEEDKELPILDLINTTIDAASLTDLRNYAATLLEAPVGRSSILGLLGHPAAPREMDPERFRDVVAVSSDTTLTLPDWSVWLFRELQAARAIAEASSAGRRTTRKRTRRK